MPINIQKSLEVKQKYNGWSDEKLTQRLKYLEFKIRKLKRYMDTEQRYFKNNLLSEKAEKRDKMQEEATDIKIELNNRKKRKLTKQNR